MSRDVVVVDDAPELRRLLCLALDRDPRLTVIASAEDGRQAIEVVGEHHPDVVLMDVAMPHLDGISATRVLARDHPHLPVIIFTGHADEGVEAEARAAGAVAFYDKTTPLAEIADALVAACDG